MEIHLTEGLAVFRDGTVRYRGVFAGMIDRAVVETITGWFMDTDISDREADRLSYHAIHGQIAAHMDAIDRQANERSRANGMARAY